MKKRFFRILLLLIGLILLFPLTTKAETFDIAAGDVDALIAAINAANANGPGADVINLETGTYTLSEVDNQYVYVVNMDGQDITWGGGPNGLPPVLGDLTINGNGSFIQRALDAPNFRLFMVAGKLTLNAVTLLHGRLTDPSIVFAGTMGGAIFNANELILNDTTLANNKASAGGAIANRGPAGGASLFYVTITDNQATQDGGGIYNSGYSSLIVENSTISYNNVGDPEVSGQGLGGGISTNGSGTVNIHASSIIGNQTTDNGLGGGMYVISGLGLLVDISRDSTISNNYAHQGGGIYSGSSTFRLTNVTLADNLGAGIFTGNGTLSFQNVLLSNNQGGNCVTLSPQATNYVSQGNNLDTDGSCNLQTIHDIDNVSAQIAPLGDNGGPTLTQALLQSSPAINAGNNAVCSAHDQRGASRQDNCDIGAFESALLPVTVLTLLKPMNGAGLNQVETSFRWTRVPEASAYDIQLGTTSDLNNAPIIRVFFPAYKPPPLLHQRYYWQVRSVSRSGSLSDWSPIWSFTVQSLPNAAPQLNFYETDSPLLTWNRVSWAIGYAVEVADNSNFQNTYWSNYQIASSVLEVQPTKPLHTGEWYWRVKARYKDGSWGDWSATGTFFVNLP